MLLIDGGKRPYAGLCKDIMDDLNCDINCIFTLLSVSDAEKFKCFI